MRCFVRSFGWYEGPDQLFIAMEYLELGDLYQYLYDKPPLPEVEAKEIAFQVLEGLSMMHENDFAHRDLKPRVSSWVSMHNSKYLLLTAFLRIFLLRHDLQINGGSRSRISVSANVLKTAMVKHLLCEVPLVMLPLSFGDLLSEVVYMRQISGPPERFFLKYLSRSKYLHTLACFRLMPNRKNSRQCSWSTRVSVNRVLISYQY